MIHVTRVARWALVISIAAEALVVRAQVDRGGQSSAPFPDRDAFLARVHAGLRTDEELQSQYTYLENRQEIRIGKLGKLQLGDVRLFEVYPSPDPDQTYRRLMAVNGVPLDPKVLRERTEAQARQRQQNIIEDVFRVYEVTLVGRDIIDGHRVIVAAMKPRTGVPTRSLPGRYFPKVGGMAWVSEDDDQVVKVRFETLSDISVGWGFLGRVNTGSRLTLERRRVNEEVWLPARTTIDLTGRTLLVRSFSVQAATEFSDYKKLRVGTTEQYRPSPN